MDLDLDEQTRDAILKHTDLIKVILGNSSVRLIEELVRLVGSDYPEKWIDFILNHSSIGQILELGLCQNISDIMKRAAQQKLPIEERIFCLLFLTIDTYKQLDSWIKQFNLSAAPHFPNNMIKFILLSKRYIDLIPSISTDVDMRWFIVKMEGNEFSQKLLRTFGVINNTNIQNLNTLFQQNKKTIVSTNDLAINGNDMMVLYDLKGKQIGDLKNLLFENIINGKLINTRDEILKYIQSNRNNC